MIVCQHGRSYAEVLRLREAAMKLHERQPSLRNAARVALMAGAAGSLALMFYAGRRQPSAILIALFTGWVASPFMGLLWLISVRYGQRQRGAPCTA